MGDTGFEPIATTPLVNNDLQRIRGPGAAKFGVIADRQPETTVTAPCSDSRLQRLNAIWDQLPEELRNTISGLVEQICRLQHV